MSNGPVKLGKGYIGVAIHDIQQHRWYVEIRSKSGLIVSVTPLCQTKMGAIEVAKSQVRGGYL